MIKISDLSFSYDQKKVIEGVEFHAKKRSFVGIVGPNGSGKSTMLKCIYRTLNPQIGSIYLEGTNLNDLKLQESAKQMSVVSQHNHVNFDFMVEDMVMMGRQPYKKALERNTREDYLIVRNALETVGMKDFSKREYSSLSGGEQQRVILARALTQEPKCLVLDEPTNHLDIKHQLHLLKIIKNLDISVIAAIHDINIALKYCDYLYVMNKGQIVKHGHPAEIVTRSLLRDVFEVDASIHELDDGLSVVFKEAIVR